MLAEPLQKSQNTKSMVFSWWTPPTKWDGRQPQAGGLDGSVRKAISTNLMISPTEEVALPLDTFLMGLKPVPSPYLVKGRLSPSAKRGQLLFTNEKKTGCTACHPSPMFTDNRQHDAGIADFDNTGQPFNTPGLSECWRTGPYGHLGSYKSIRDLILLRTHATGVTDLSTQELDDLVNYVLSL
jgi:cytochrome c peroxidase